jgi:hypothetical protein
MSSAPKHRMEVEVDGDWRFFDDTEGQPDQQ